jgi:glyoxylase-like metal-dependent hydrolase (beta-lactamase superfamily II)
MLKVERFVNELMTSNCYIVADEASKHCICIDPASEKSLREIEFIEKNGLTLDYIILTHEHTDHNWGVNSLREHFLNCKLICSEPCNKYVKKTNRAYFLFYYDDPDYRYEIAPADILIKEDVIMDWNGIQIQYMMTSGHSYGSMCIDVDGMLFTGDTIMPFRPYFNGRDSNEEDWKQSVSNIKMKYSNDTIVNPGHGDTLTLGGWIDNYCKLEIL